MSQEFPTRALFDAQEAILEQMAGGVPLREILCGVTKLVEKLAPPALCSVILVEPDGKHLKPLAAPSLPPDFCAMLDGVEICPNCGSCGTAVWRKEPVIITDIATDPLFETFRERALSFGLRACWSLPVMTGDQTVLGTVTLYWREPRSPTERDWNLVHSCVKLVRLALAFDRKERMLYASQTRWRIGAEMMGLGTYDRNFATGIDTWSAATRQILGVTDDAPACLETFLERVHPDNRAEFLAQVARGPQLPCTDAWQFELRIIRADTGEERIVLAKGCVVPSADGSLAGHAVGTITDITEQRRYEEELRRDKAQADAANRAKSRFLASMSHELRTPLNAIIGFSDLIRAGVYGPVGPARYAGYIDDIYKSGNHLLSLINDVLDMAKIEAQRFELIRTWVPLANLCESALVMVRLQAEAKGILLVSDIENGLTINVDERAMRQVLVNLLSNSVKFTGGLGTVRLFAKRQPDGGLSIGVEDTGHGMDKEGLSIALEPFGQVQMDVAAERSGTGLGLPIAKALLEYHGAVFHITSTLGVGTQVWGDFPAKDVAEQPAAVITGRATP